MVASIYIWPQKVLGPPRAHPPSFPTGGPCGERPHPRAPGPRASRGFCRLPWRWDGESPWGQDIQSSWAKDSYGMRG